MAKYVPNTNEESLAMLHEIGLNSYEDLFNDIPESVLLKELNLQSSQSEYDTLKQMKALADKNIVFPTIFRGAGAYRHYIPAALKSIVSKDEFLTAYTPYQAEISQGILQAIFEYQTMMCELTGMSSSNASVYDGATAAAEAVAMCKERKKNVVLVSSCANPQVIETIKTYCFGNELEVKMINEDSGVDDANHLSELLTDEVACVYVEQPNYYGNLADFDKTVELSHDKNAKVIMGCNPIALSVMKTPAMWGADIAVGEGQPLGMPLNFGGPYLGFMCCTEKLTRKLPGRIVGQTVDKNGKRSFVLTLQAREQHIRREKATSNICSNQAHCALTASVYLSLMSHNGLSKCANLCHSKATYLKEKLQEINYVSKHNHPFFHEFVTTCPVDAEKALATLQENNILGGLALDEKHILWCVTEVNTKEEMDSVIQILKGVQA